MRRGGWIGGGIFLFLAFLWAALDPLLAYRDVASFRRPDADHGAAETRLLQRGRAALPALRQGTHSADLGTRLRCARLLALNSEADGETLLLAALAHDSDDAETAFAQHLLLALYDERRAPPPQRAATLLGELPPDRPLLDHREQELDLLLTQYQSWSGGYAARARLHLQQDEPRLAERDAARALLFEPNDFEAMWLLARVYHRLASPEVAFVFAERALRLCPRLEHEMADELEKLRAAAQAERERRLKERLYERPLL
jgi:hypothetical protein